MKSSKMLERTERKTRAELIATLVVDPLVRYPLLSPKSNSIIMLSQQK